MKVAQTYHNNQIQNFKGVIKPSKLYDISAKEYAQSVKVGDTDWNKLRLFINTIRALKNDGTNNEFILDTRMTPNGQYWYVKYGDYCNKNEYFDTGLYYGKSCGAEKLEEDAFKMIIQFGKEYFGLKELSKPITELAPVEKFLKRANMFLSKSRTEKNNDIRKKLIEKANKETQKADDAVKDIKIRLINDL